MIIEHSVKKNILVYEQSNIIILKISLDKVLDRPSKES
jgi:hypothetical protein